MKNSGQQNEDDNDVDEDDLLQDYDQQDAELLFSVLNNNELFENRIGLAKKNN